jgi:hypothetical protein
MDADEVKVMKLDLFANGLALRRMAPALFVPAIRVVDGGGSLVTWRRYVYGGVFWTLAGGVSWLDR